MIFQDNVIKEYLKNVYFITGTPCGGKTTVSRALAEKYGFELFDVDERFDEHKKMSNPLFQPAMNTYFNSADEFFGRTVEEYKKITNYENTKKVLKEIKLEIPEVPNINEISKFSIKRDEKILKEIIKPKDDLIKELYNVIYHCIKKYQNNPKLLMRL